MLYFYFFNMLKVGVPGFTQTPQLLVYNLTVWLCVNSWGRVKKEKVQNRACVACHTRLNNKSESQEAAQHNKQKAKNDPADLKK